MIKIRLDVDYPYPSRMKSFLFTAINRKTIKDYLKNSKIIARMINESTKEVRAYWFFTPQTIPDKELMALLEEDKHEIALHVANDAYAELESLKKQTGRNVRYYTIHGTARILARLMWRRGIRQARATIPTGFPLKNFWDFPTLRFDNLCYTTSTAEARRIAEESIVEGKILHVHPEWLFQRGTINQRGPYYEPLKDILQVDAELSGIAIKRKGFARIAKHPETEDYSRDFVPSDRFIKKLEARGVDIFTFLERSWCFSTPNLSKEWVKTEDNVALVKVTTYPDWLEQIGKKTRNMIRKAEKSGVKTEVVQPGEKLAEGIWRIYNETPIRQERPFPHYGQSLQIVKGLTTQVRDTFIAACLKDEIVGFVQLVHGDNVARIAQILSLQKYSDKAVNNALIAKTVEVCAAKHSPWLIYARMGNHPSLDNFKRNNGFTKIEISRYYVPLTGRGRAALLIGLHRETGDLVPERLKYSIIPVYNWINRSKVRFKRKDVFA